MKGRDWYDLVWFAGRYPVLHSAWSVSFFLDVASRIVITEAGGVGDQRQPS